MIDAERKFVVVAIRCSVCCWALIISPCSYSFDYHTIRRAGVTNTLLFEGEANFVRGDHVRRQDMRSYGSGWSGNAHLLWEGEIGGEVEVDFVAPRESKYKIHAMFTPWSVLS